MYYVEKMTGQNMYIYEVKLEREKIIELRNRICNEHSRVIRHTIIRTSNNGGNPLNYYKDYYVSRYYDAFSNIGHNRDIYTGEDTAYLKSSCQDISYDEVVHPEIVLLIDKLLSGDNSVIKKILHPGHIAKIRERKYIPYYLELSKYIKLDLLDIRQSAMDDNSYDVLGYDYQDVNSMIGKTIVTYRRRIKK